MFKYSQFSKNQMRLLTWWMPKSTKKSMNGIIAEGAVRSGKTIIMGLSFVFWSMQSMNGTRLAICGKTVSSTRRNIVEPLVPLLRQRGYKVIDRRTEGKLIISRKGRINTYYIFGGRDESSASLIQGLTLSGVLLDEVALMPRSFVEQAMARCSVDGSKYWFNCNPEGPMHWFKVNYIDRAEELKLLKLHFLLDDNLSLSDEIKQRYKTMYTGIFYKRFILGEWAFSDGVIYSNIPEETYYNTNNRDKIVPIKIREHDIHPIYGTDYGITNPMVYLEIYTYYEPGNTIPYFYVDNEYYFDSKKEFRQKTDNEYIEDFEYFKSDEYYRFIVCDPSAESLIIAHQRKGHRIIKAKNDVLPGINMINTLFSIGHIKINKDRCPNLCNELAVYQWDSKKSEHGLDQPLKSNDHACDALRYAIFTTTNKYQVYPVE